MENIGYYNGRTGLIEDMMIPMNDRACYFGDGVYDATCCKNNVIYLIEDHLDRFFNSAGLLRIDLPFTKAEISASVGLPGCSMAAITDLGFAEALPSAAADRPRPDDRPARICNSCSPRCRANARALRQASS